MVAPKIGGPVRPNTSNMPALNKTVTLKTKAEKILS